MANFQEKSAQGMHPAIRLLSQPAAELTAWYGDPMVRQSEIRLSVPPERKQQFCFQAGLLALIVQYWSGYNTAADYRRLVERASTAHEQALLELVYGQLLMGRKLTRAVDHLARGLSGAAQLLNTRDYFRLVQRHDLLACLCLSETGSEAFTLEALLVEAAVVRRLRSGENLHNVHAHFDTVG